ncbi:hypothetical protein BGZ96_011536, partial [Linnemannia gamsii]
MSKKNQVGLKKKAKIWGESKNWDFDQNFEVIDSEGNKFQYDAEFPKRLKKAEKDARYENLHAVLKPHLLDRLRAYYGFAKIRVPALEGGRANAHAYVSPDVYVNSKTLVIVQGLGRVYPGIWARKLLTSGRNGDYKCATMFSYIRKALSFGWSVVICDPNGDGNSEQNRCNHVRRVWETIIMKSVSTCAMVVAFSAGTRAALEILGLNDADAIKIDFKHRVKGIVLLDGSTGSSITKEADKTWLQSNHRLLVMLRKTPKAIPPGTMFAVVQFDPGMQEGNNVTDLHDYVPGFAFKQ